MLARSALFAIAASALSLAALVPTDASARHGGGIGNHPRVARFVHNHPRLARFVHNHPGVARFAHNHPRLFIRNQVLFRRHFVYNHWRWAWRPGHFCWRHPFYCQTRVYRPGVLPVVGAVPAIAAPAYAAPTVAAPAVPYGRCLIQTRLADGNSLFRNVCTNEAAITNGGESEPPPPIK